MRHLASYAPVSTPAINREPKVETERAPARDTSGFMIFWPGSRRGSGRGPVDPIHSLLAYAAAVITVVGIAWSLYIVLRSRPDPPSFELFQAAVVSLIIVGAASG